MQTRTFTKTWQWVNISFLHGSSGLSFQKQNRSSPLMSTLLSVMWPTVSEIWAPMGYPKEQNRLRENETVKNENTKGRINRHKTRRNSRHMICRFETITYLTHYLFYYVKKLLEDSSVIKVINFILEQNM